MSTPILDRLIHAMQASPGVPASERSVVSVLGALDSDDTGKQEVVKHIIEDFALTQRVLKLANSSMYAPFGVGAASVTAALNVLDPEALMHLVLSTDLITEEELRADASLSQTLFASELARQACGARAEDASIATLMFQIGQLMTAKYLPEEARAIERLCSLGVDAQDAASDVLGMSFQEIGVELASRWNLPNYILSSINGTGDPTLVGISRFSSQAAALVYQGKSELVQELLQALDLPDVDKAGLDTLIRTKIADVQPPPAPVVAPAPPASPAAIGQLHSAIRQEKRRVIDDLAKVMLPLYAGTLQSNRCLLFMLTRSGEFRIRAGYGPHLEALQQQLIIAAEFAPTAFHLAIRNKVEIVIDDTTRLKPSALPAVYRQLLPLVRQFIIVPIASSQVSGLVYCDWELRQEMRPAQLDAVKKLRDLFAPFFP